MSTSDKPVTINTRDFKKSAGGEIPDLKDAPTGILGVKAPSSYRQTGDIQDRLMAAGILKPGLK